MWLCVYRADERGREAERYRLINFFFFFTLPLSASLPPSLMNYQCFEVISMQGPDSKLGSQPLSLQTHERAISDAGSCCNLSSCAVLGNMSVHLNPVSAGNARRKRWLQGEHRRICLCVFINPWGAEHVWNLLFFPLSLSICSHAAVCKHSSTRRCKPAIDWRKKVSNDVFWIHSMQYNSQCVSLALMWSGTVLLFTFRRLKPF